MSGTLCSLESLVSLPPDLRFVVRERGGRERTIEAHKYFLARASPVFRALLYSSWGGAAPAPAPAPEQVTIEGTTHEAFSLVVEFCYTGRGSAENTALATVREAERLARWYHLPALARQLGSQQPAAAEWPGYDDTTTTSPAAASKFLDLLPPDVTFIIEAEAAADCGAEDSTVSGHKYHLALHSPVFRRMLFGPLQQDTVTIKGTTLEAFQALIDYIYGHPVMLAQKCAAQLFEILNLAEMYDVPGLKTLSETSISELKLTSNNVLEVASEAEAWSQFEEVSGELLERCTIFLARAVLRTKDDLIEFSRRHSDSALSATAFRLLGRLPRCQNCYHTPCLKGALISMDQVSCDWWTAGHVTTILTSDWSRWRRGSG